MFDDYFDEEFYKLGMIYLKGYKNFLQQNLNKHWFRMEMLYEDMIPKEILSSLFDIMVKNKMLEPIEKMSEEDTEWLRTETRKYCAGMDDKGKMKIAKSIMCLNKLSQIELNK